jgi:hypothetical protein
MAMLLFALGCKTDSARPRTAAAPASTKGGGLPVLAVEAPPPSTNRVEPAPVALPASGRIHDVVAGSRFVIVDYTLGGMPALHSVVHVYRGGEKVGELRLSGPERNGFVAADILNGFIQVDDEVRLY